MEVHFVVCAIVEVGVELTVATNGCVGIPCWHIEGTVTDLFDCDRSRFDLLLCCLELSHCVAGFGFCACSFGFR